MRRPVHSLRSQPDRARSERRRRVAISVLPALARYTDDLQCRSQIHHRCGIWIDARGAARCSSAAASLIRLRRRALHRSEGAEDAAVARKRSQHDLAVLALVEKLTSVGRHGFLFDVRATRACQRGLEHHLIHPLSNQRRNPHARRNERHWPRYLPMPQACLWSAVWVSMCAPPLLKNKPSFKGECRQAARMARARDGAGHDQGVARTCRTDVQVPGAGARRSEPGQDQSRKDRWAGLATHESRQL